MLIQFDRFALPSGMSTASNQERLIWAFYSGIANEAVNR